MRAKNQLVVLDTFDDVKKFIDANQVAFISHQCASPWLAHNLFPTLVSCPTHNFPRALESGGWLVRVLIQNRSTSRQ